MRIDKLKVVPLVTPEEAIKLMNTRTIADMYITEEIEKSFKNLEREVCDPIWEKFRLFALIWNAGRIQGIREERRKRNRIYA